MDFFAQQAKVRRSSRWLVLLFVLAVLAVVAAVDVVVLVVAGFGRAEQGGSLGVDPGTLALISFGVLLLIGLASTVRTLSLRGGGAAVAQHMGATAVPPDTSNPAWRKLRNVIEEIAIASSVPVPDIFVLESEPGINAFAAGFTPSDAAICVTQGCLDRLTRDELQGVIAHEFSHVLNGDMRLNIRLMGLLFGILVIGIIGRILMYSGGRVRSRKGNTAYVALVGLGLLVVGYVGFFFGRLIQAAVARSREALADASAVQFTRQTRGIAGALKKIAAMQEGSQLAAANSQEVAHMLFGEPGAFSRLFATHPPLPERIRALGGYYDEKEIEQLARAWMQPQRARHGEDSSASISGFVPAFATAGSSTAPHVPLPRTDRPLQVDAHEVSKRVGRPQAHDMHAAGQLQRQLPDALRQAAHDASGALELVLALAVSDNAHVRDAQLLQVDSGFGSGTAEGVEALLPPLSILHPMLHLPLVALAFPQLKRQPRPKLQSLQDTLQAMIHADQRVDLHEYTLVKLLRLMLADALDPSGGFVPGSKRLRQVQADYAMLCAIVASQGHADNEAARRAWARGMHEALPNARADFVVPADWQASLDSALERIDRIRPLDKQLVVRGLTQVVVEDQEVNVVEAELLRVICASLHCPLPPMLHHLTSFDTADEQAQDA
jgi:Zn-dependent protease with chaperone function